MSNPSKKKGYLFEAELKKKFRKAGFTCERLAQPNQPDLYLEGFGFIEAKCRAKEFKSIYDYLDKCHALIIKRQSNKDKGRKALVVIDLETFIHLLLISEVVKD